MDVADKRVRFESNLKEGKQSSDKGREHLEYGVSITDGEVVSSQPMNRSDILVSLHRLGNDDRRPQSTERGRQSSAAMLKRYPADNTIPGLTQAQRTAQIEIRQRQWSCQWDLPWRATGLEEAEDGRVILVDEFLVETGGGWPQS